MNLAKSIQQAGADALELNIYSIPTDINTTSAQVEQNYLDILAAVQAEVTIPIAMKLSPFFSNMANMAKRKQDGDVKKNNPSSHTIEKFFKNTVLLARSHKSRKFILNCLFFYHTILKT
jgi:hypothetical protein